MKCGGTEMVLLLHHALHPNPSNPPSWLTGAAYGWRPKSPGTAADTHVTLAIPFYSLGLVFLIFTRKVGAVRVLPALTAGPLACPPPQVYVRADTRAGKGG